MKKEGGKYSEGEQQAPSKAEKIKKMGKNKGRYVKWESRRKLKNQYQLPMAEPPPLAPLIS